MIYTAIYRDSGTFTQIKHQHTLDTRIKYIGMPHGGSVKHLGQCGYQVSRISNYGTQNASTAYNKLLIRKPCPQLTTNCSYKLCLNWLHKFFRIKVFWRRYEISEIQTNFRRQNWNLILARHFGWNDPHLTIPVKNSKYRIHTSF